MWFAPQVNMTVVFTGTLAVVLGLGFWLGMLAMVIGTVVGCLAVGYLSTWGPRTGTAQLPNARMAFGGTVAVVAVIQWLSSIAWDGLVGLFGGEALAELLGMPFWVAVVIVLAAQGVVGVFGYEVIHRVQAVMTVVLIITFAVFAWKLIGGHQVISLPTVSGADLGGAFVLEVTIALSLAISWASYASDYSRYLPVHTSRAAVFGYTFAGLAVAYIAVQAIGVAAAGGADRPDRGRCAPDHGRWRAGRAGAAGDRAGLGGLQRDERLQRVAGAADRRCAGAQAGVGGGGGDHRVRPHHVAALR